MDPWRAREILLAEENRLKAQIKELSDSGLRAGARDAVQELSMYDNHPADSATETFERGKDIGLKDNLKILLEKTRDAIDRIDRGEWGRCERCGATIEPARLEAMPMTTMCMRCKRDQESVPKASARPMEEGVIEPPFGHPHLEVPDSVAYDGVDTWEDVARHGSSYTPQDQPGSVDYDHIYLEEPPDSGVVDEVEGIAGSDHTVIHDEERKRKAHGRGGEPA